MCFINLATQIILEEEGLDKLIPSTCWGNPCVALKETGEHLHNLDGNIVRPERDYLDCDTLLKLIGKSN